MFRKCGALFLITLSAILATRNYDSSTLLRTTARFPSSENALDVYVRVSFFFFV